MVRPALVCVDGSEPSKLSPVVIKNQLLRVYSKLYDQNGTVLLIRMMRYSLDGFLFSEVRVLLYPMVECMLIVQ